MNLHLSRSRVLAALFAIPLVLALVPLHASAADNSVDAVKKRGVLKVGVKFDQPYIGYLDPKGGSEPVGFEIDLARAIAKQILGDAKKIQFTQVTSKNRIQQVENGDIDFFIATATITPERLNQINFSNVYYRAGQSLLVKANSPIKTYQDLKGKTVCSVSGSTPEKTIRRLVPEAKVEVFETYTDCFQGLQQGRNDAMTTDDVILHGFQQQDEKNLKMVGGQFTFEPYGIGIAKGNDSLTKAVNTALANITKGKNSDYARAYQQWFKKPLERGYTAWYGMDAAKAGQQFADQSSQKK